jgi:DNA modification methylase
MEMSVCLDRDGVTIHNGDCLEVLRTLPDESVQCCVTSPPYWGLRDYGHDGQIGLESTPEAYVGRMVEVFREVRRVLREDGTLWLNLGDSYAANKSERTRSQSGECERPCAKATNLPAMSMPPELKPKDLVGIPWRVAFALQADGWYLRQDIIWHKPNPMPESVTDRCTKAHEYVFLMAKSQRYYYDAEAISEAATNRECGNIQPTKAGRTGQDKHRTAANLHSIEARETRNRRSVWTVCTKPYSGAHFAVMPPDLVKPCILAGCPEGGVVLDPFMGSGTVAAVAQDAGRRAIGIELNPEYCKLIAKRFKQRRIL